MLKLSECGFPKRRLWLTLRSIAAQLTELISVIATHREILANCGHCKRPQFFELDYSRSNKTLFVYNCGSCGRGIEVENDLPSFTA
jgi:hypothetical protein